MTKIKIKIDKTKIIILKKKNYNISVKEEKKEILSPQEFHFTNIPLGLYYNLIYNIIFKFFIVKIN